MINEKDHVKYRAFEFSRSLIKFLGDLPNTRISRIIGDQVLRSGTSVGANIIEGKSSSSKKEFIRYYEIALKSSNETKYWLLLLKDSYKDKSKKIETLFNEIESISRILAAGIITMKKSLKTQ